MNFFKDKEKQRFSLRKNKAYGLASALLGITVIGTVATNIEQIKPIVHMLNAQAADTNPKPSGQIIAQGEDGVPWELYENGYLLFKPEAGKDTLANDGGNSNWKREHGAKIKHVGFAGKVYAPASSSYLFSKKSYRVRRKNHKFNPITFDTTHLDTSKVTDMYAMFAELSNLTNLDVTHFDTSKVTDMGYMFSELSNLTNLDVTHFDTSKVTNMQYMFSELPNLTNLDVTHFDTSKVTNMSRMFTNTSNLTNLDVTHFDTSKVTDMQYMFYGMSKLTNLDVTHFDTSKVTDMGAMFSNMSSLTNLDVTHFDTSKVTDMGSMFYSMSKLTNLDVTNFNTSKVLDMHSMFSSMSSLTNLDVTHFDTSNVTVMDSMFYNASNLTSLDVTHFDTSKVTDMSSMFEGMSSVTDLDVTRFDTRKVTNMLTMFANMSNLIKLDVSKFDTSNVTNMNVMFYGMSKLKEIKLGDKFSAEGIRTIPIEHVYGDQYTDKWYDMYNKEHPYTVEEWAAAYAANPIATAGTWIRESTIKDAILTFPGENLAPIRVRPTDTELPQLSLPGKPKPNHKFLGWSKDGKNLLTREEAKPGETIALQPLWQPVNDNTIVTEVIPVTTAYRGDNNLDYGKSQETPGTPGEKHIIATYSVAPYTGELKKLAEKTEIVRDMIPKVITKGTKPKVEIINRNGARVRKTTNYTVDPNSGNVLESVSYSLVKGVDSEEIANENSWEKRERLTDQAVPIEKITTYTMRPENGEVTTSVRYEIAGGQGAKKDTLDTIDDVPGKEVAIVKKGHHILNTETGKLTSTIQYARKDGQGNEWETRERLTDQELPIDKITKHTLNPETGDIAKEVHYEIVDGKGPKKDTFDKVENVNQDGNDLVKTTHFTLNVTTGKLSKNAPTFTKKSGGENVTETRERLTDQDLPIDKITKSTFDPTTGRTTKEVRYEIVDGKGPKKDTFDKVEDSESEGIPLTKTTHYTLDVSSGKLTKDASVYARKDGSKENEWETVERLTDQELPINKITKFTLDPSSGTVTKEVHYEIVDGKGDKKDTFDKEETINKEGIEILKSTHFTLDTNSGKLTSASTYVRKDGSGSVWETRERLTDQELPIDKITKHTLDLDTGEIAKEVRYEIVDGKGPKKDTFDKKENSESNGVELVKTTPFTLNTETGKLTKGEPTYSRKEEGPNEWDTTERLTDQELPIDKFTKFSLNPTTGEVTKQSRYEIVNGIGDKKDHFDKVEEVNKNGVDLIKTTPFTLNTETGKLKKGESTFSRKDKQDLSTETRERLTDQELPIDKITKTTVDPRTGEVTKEVRYEIVDGLGDKKDHFNKVEEINQNGLDLIKTTQFTLNTETGKLTKGEPTFTRKDGQPLEHEISESVTGKELPIIKYTKTIVNPTTGEVTKQIRYEIANGFGDKKDSFDKVEEVESNGITLIKTTHYKLNPETGELTKESVVFKRKDGKDNVVETVERLTDQELPINKFTKVTLNPETGEVTIEVRYEIVDGQGDKKDAFDKVEEVEEQGIKLRKSTHYTLDKNGALSKTVTYSLPNGKTEFDKVETLKRNGQTVEKTTHYKLNPDTGKFEIATSEKVLTANGLDENGNKLTAPTVDKSEYTKSVGGSNSDGEGGTIEVLKHEKPEHKGSLTSNGVNENGESIDPPTVDKPEYKGTIGSNGVDENGNEIKPPVLEIKEYSNAIASNGVNDKGESIDPPKVDIPEYTGDVQKPTEVTQTTQQSEQKPDTTRTTTQQKVIQVDDNKPKDKLPKTGVESLIGITATGLVAAIGAAFAKLRKKK